VVMLMMVLEVLVMEGRMKNEMEGRGAEGNILVAHVVYVII